MAVDDLAICRDDLVQRADVLAACRDQLDDSGLSSHPARVGRRRAVYDVLTKHAGRALAFHAVGDPERVEFGKRYDVYDNSPD